jgi:hypothetical protein
MPWKKSLIQGTITKTAGLLEDHVLQHSASINAAGDRTQRRQDAGDDDVHCDFQEISSMTSIYDRDELAFQYPANWDLAEDPPHGFPRCISVTAETGAFWSATVYDQREVSLNELSRRYEDTLTNEYEDVEFDEVEIDLPTGRVVATECSFYCLDFLVRSRLMAVRLGSHHLLIAWQAEDREFDGKERVFLAITISLLGDTKPVR